MRRPRWVNPIDEWFAPKPIGFGFMPATWEGWLVTLVAVAAVVSVPVIISEALRHPDPAAFSHTAQPN